jgi:hypothetical protein
MPPVGFEPTTPAGERPQATRLLRSWVQIPPGAWIFVCCECRVLSGRGLCDELITRPEESYRLWCIIVCDLETSRMGAPYTQDTSSLRVKWLKLITERSVTAQKNIILRCTAVKISKFAHLHTLHCGLQRYVQNSTFSRNLASTFIFKAG